MDGVETGWTEPYFKPPARPKRTNTTTLPRCGSRVRIPSSAQTVFRSEMPWSAVGFLPLSDGLASVPGDHSRVRFRHLGDTGFGGQATLHRLRERP